MTGDRDKAGLTRIVALRPCGHVAAFASVEDLLRGQGRCPQCEGSTGTSALPDEPTARLAAGRAPLNGRRKIE